MVFFHTCGPDEAMVVSGCCRRHPTMVPGGRAFVWPVVQRFQKLSLRLMTLEVVSAKVISKLGVPISVTGAAQVKVQGSSKQMLADACCQFLGKTEAEIRNVALETLEGHQRAIMGLMTVEEIYRDRHKFYEKVFEVASSDLVNMGIAVVSYTLKDVADDEGYLLALGMGRTAEVKRDARIGEAEATKASSIRSAVAEEARLSSKYKNDILIAQAKRDFELQKAGFDKDVNTRKAKADLAYQLQAAKMKQKIKEEEMEVKVVERTQQIALQKQEIVRKERELDATVRRSAEAEKFRLEKLAEAARRRILLQKSARAEAQKMRGEAVAFATEVKGKADSEQMLKKAEAWRDYKQAAVVEMVVDALPNIAAKVAEPLTKGVQKVTLVSTGSGEVGVARLTGEVMDIMSRLPKLVNEMTGVDISKVVKQT